MSFEFSKQKPQAVHLFDLRVLAQQIEIRLEKLLAPPPQGIYIAGTVEPVLIPGETYFTKQDGSLQPLTDLKDATGAIYDKAGKKLIPASFVKNKDNLISTEPIEPYRGIMIAEFFINRYIDGFISWRRHRSGHFDRVLKYFKDEATEGDDWYDLLERIEGGVCQELYEWLEGKSWNIFTTARVGMTMRVERYEDYRILDWMERYESKEITL